MKIKQNSKNLALRVTHTSCCCRVFFKKIFLLPLLFIFINPIPCDENEQPQSQISVKKPKEIVLEKLPEIPSLNSRDEIFKEYISIVDENYQLVNAGKEPLILFFKYNVPKDANLLTLAARCNIPYETIATINEITNSKESLSGKTIILPTVAGLFISENSKNSIQIILKNRYILDLQNANLCYNYNTISFSFLQNERFSPTERAYFLDASLGLPIDAGLSYISSSFGKRKNPFSGEWKNHKGVDFASAEGTPVKAVKSGKVALCIKNDKTFGNYIILSHDANSMTSVYAHLSKICVSLNENVKKGDIIGYVGQTGMATGPHLHFEVRFGGVAEDPEKVLPIR